MMVDTCYLDHFFLFSPSPVINFCCSLKCFGKVSQIVKASLFTQINPKKRKKSFIPCSESGRRRLQKENYVRCIRHPLRRRANARNVSFLIFLRWPIHIMNPVDKTKLSCKTPHRRSTRVSVETYPLCSYEVTNVLITLKDFDICYFLFTYRYRRMF